MKTSETLVTALREAFLFAEDMRYRGNDVRKVEDSVTITCGLTRQTVRIVPIPEGRFLIYRGGAIPRQNMTAEDSERAVVEAVRKLMNLFLEERDKRKWQDEYLNSLPPE